MKAVYKILVVSTLAGQVSASESRRRKGDSTTSLLLSGALSDMNRPQLREYAREEALRRLISAYGAPRVYEWLLGAPIASPQTSRSREEALRQITSAIGAPRAYEWLRGAPIASPQTSRRRGGLPWLPRGRGKRSSP
jgi:hypothetical protein